MNNPIASRLKNVLDLARWAPSGDNSQVWRFEVVADDHVVVHGHDTRDTCVYDLDGTASQIAIGALLETMAIASTRFGLRAEATRRVDSPDERPLIDVRFMPDKHLPADALVPCIDKRSVNRRPLGMRPLTELERETLEAAVGSEYKVIWRDGFSARRRIASLLFACAKLRMTTPEALFTHWNAMDWGQQFSVDRLPERSVGFDPLTGLIMRYVMKSWPRVQFFNRYLAGTWLPRIQMDLLPALACASHFLLVANKAPRTIDDFIAAGRSMQRFWLTVTHLGLQMQPEVTPLIFTRYSRESLRFSSAPGIPEAAARFAKRMADEFGTAETANSVFMGRIGAGKAARSRSLRLPLEALMVRPSEMGC